MLPRMLLGVICVALLTNGVHAQTTRMSAEEKIKELQQQMLDMQSQMQEQMTRMQKEMEALKTQQQQEREETNKQQAENLQQVQTAQEEFREKTLGLFERVKLGGYGSTRFEANSLDQLHDTFTLRRLVLTTDAKIAPRLRFYLELEYERFRKQSWSERQARRRRSRSRTSDRRYGWLRDLARQAWLQYDLTKWLSVRTGAVLVPLGRFNLRHDDNLWNLPRRSLVDRGVPVCRQLRLGTNSASGLSAKFRSANAVSSTINSTLLME